MARKAARKRASSRTTVPAPKPDASPRERIVAALMALLAEKPIERIGLAEVAAAAGVPLSRMRGEFGSLMAILGAHVKMIDAAVLDGVDPALADEPARERLFDVLMRRLEALVPHRAAMRSLLRSAMRHPGMALALNALAVRSQHWMLTAANIDAAGPKGAIRAQGLTLLFANVLRTFVDDEDADLSRSMAALDRELDRGERLSGFLDDLCAVPACVGRGARRRRGKRRDRDESGEAYAA